MDYCGHIGFPFPLLGKENLRLSILHNNNGLLAINKPQNIVIDYHPWYKKFPSLIDTIKNKDQIKKKETIKLCGKVFKSIYHLDPECTGIALITTNSSINKKIRNDYGSSRIIFKVLLVVEGGRELKPLIKCNLPLVNEKNKNRVRVSHIKGKKSITYFKRLENIGDYSIWEANTNYLRMHQIRIHAYESGLRIIGESIYDKVNLILLSQFKKKYKSKNSIIQPLYSGIHMHLEKIKMPLELMDNKYNENFIIKAPKFSRMNTLIKKLKKYAS